MCEKNTEFVNPDFGRTYNQIAYFTFESDNILDRNSLSNVMVIGIIWFFFLIISGIELLDVFLVPYRITFVSLGLNSLGCKIVPPPPSPNKKPDKLS